MKPPWWLYDWNTEVPKLSIFAPMFDTAMMAVWCFVVLLDVENVIYYLYKVSVYCKILCYCRGKSLPWKEVSFLSTSCFTGVQFCRILEVMQNPGDSVCYGFLCIYGKCRPCGCNCAVWCVSFQNAITIWPLKFFGTCSFVELDSSGTLW